MGTAVTLFLLPVLLCMFVPLCKCFSLCVVLLPAGHPAVSKMISCLPWFPLYVCQTLRCLPAMALSSMSPVLSQSTGDVLVCGTVCVCGGSLTVFGLRCAMSMMCRRTLRCRGSEEGGEWATLLAPLGLGSGSNNSGRSTCLLATPGNTVEKGAGTFWCNPWSSFNWECTVHVGCNPHGWCWVVE